MQLRTEPNRCDRSHAIGLPRVAGWRTHGTEMMGGTHARRTKPRAAMYRLRLAHEVDSD
jgi:hypothetical protein